MTYQSTVSEPAVQCSGVQTVHVIDNDDAVRATLLKWIQTAGFNAKGYASAGEFLLSAGWEPGCILLEFRLPGVSGFELQESMNRNGSWLPIIFLTGHGDIPTAVRAIKAGAVDFLTKPVQRERLLKALKTAMAIHSESLAANRKFQRCRASFDKMSGRQQQIFKLVVTGRLNKQIALDLGLAERTVKLHRAEVMDRMNAGSLAELVHFAATLQYKSPSPVGSAR